MLDWNDSFSPRHCLFSFTFPPVREGSTSPGLLDRDKQQLGSVESRTEAWWGWKFRCAAERKPCDAGPRRWTLRGDVYDKNGPVWTFVLQRHKHCTSDRKSGHSPSSVEITFSVWGRVESEKFERCPSQRRARRSLLSLRKKEKDFLTEGILQKPKRWERLQPASVLPWASDRGRVRFLHMTAVERRTLVLCAS